MYQYLGIHYLLNEEFRSVPPPRPPKKKVRNHATVLAEWWMLLCKFVTFLQESVHVYFAIV